MPQQVACRGVERLYLSDRAVYAPGQAVRGGVPVVFPQFAAMGPLAKHGFARTLPWTLKSVDTTPTDALAVLQLRSGDATRAAWPFEFALELSLRVSAQRLDMAYEEGLAHYQIGSHLAARDPARRQHLQRAAEIFAQLHAVRDHTCAETAMAEA